MTTATEPATEPPEVAEMRAESERRLSLMDAASLVKPKGDTPDAGKPAATATAVDPAKDTAAKEPAKADTPSTATPTATTTDLSFIDEKHRSHFEKLPAETIAFLKEQAALSGKAKSIQAEFTRRTQEFAESAEDRATLKSIMEDEEAVKALIELRDRRAGKAVEDEEDYNPLDPDQRKAHEAKLREQSASDAVSKIKADEDAKAAVRAERTEIADHVLGSLTTKGYTVEQIDGKFKRFGGYDGLKAMAGASGEKFTKEYVESVMSESLPPVAAKPKDEPKPGARVESKASGASAVGRSVGGSSPITAPAFMREGKAPSTLDELLAESLFIANAKRAARGEPQIDY